MRDERNERRSLGRRDGEAGSALVVALVLLLLLVSLGTAVLTLSGLESQISHNDLWSEGAFHAAEAGIHVAIDQLDPDPAVAVQAIPLTQIEDRFLYRSGDRFSAGPEALEFVGKDAEAGFGLGVGTGYNPSGYAFSNFRINATGIGPRNALREIEVLAQYGPVAE